MTTVVDTQTTAQQLGAGLSHGAGRILIAPALAAALDAPDVRSAMRGIFWSAGLTIGGCIFGGILLARLLSPK